jgi:hypothetical protein
MIGDPARVHQAPQRRTPVSGRHAAEGHEAHATGVSFEQAACYVRFSSHFSHGVARRSADLAAGVAEQSVGTLWRKLISFSFLPRGMLPLGSRLGSTNHNPPFSNI